MLEKLFIEVYSKFKINFYKSIFQPSDYDSISPVELFTAEVIHVMGKPTISQVANFIDLSYPNMNYRINSLVKKGFVRKIYSQEDKRETFLKTTENFYKYLAEKDKYIYDVLERSKKRFSEEEMKVYIKILKVLSEELMPDLIEIEKNKKLNQKVKAK